MPLGPRLDAHRQHPHFIITPPPPSLIPSLSATDISPTPDEFRVQRPISPSPILKMIPNIHGLSEVITSIGFCDDIGVCGRSGTTKTNWNRDDSNSTEPNIHGSHSAYLEYWI
ncbi:hypothetical protein EDC04DRAFT_1630389 [Pisolithus marmoratus]|nr:hypothetical protein EDC04DRAFT_1630389 [Pisolithus marmoratus]